MVQLPNMHGSWRENEMSGNGFFLVQRADKRKKSLPHDIFLILSGSSLNYCRSPCRVKSAMAVSLKCNSIKMNYRVRPEIDCQGWEITVEDV